MDLNRDKIDFGSGKIGATFRAIFFPTLIGMVSITLATVIDGIFVGRGVGAGGMAAVNIVAPMWMVVTGIGLMFSVGASVVASIHMAEGNRKAACIILTQAFGVGFVMLALMSVGMWLWARPVVYLLGCSAALESNALDYLLGLLPGMVFLFWQCVGMMLIRLDGSPRYSMLVQVASAAVNIVLDWAFIFPMGMGVKGAAIATAIACGVGGVMALVYFVWFSASLKFYRLKASLTSLLLTLRNTWYMVKLGFATFLGEIAMSVLMLTGNYMFMSLLHEDGVAAFAVVCYLFPVIFSIDNAVAQSAQPIISYNYGARQTVRVTSALRVSVFTSALCGVLVMLLLWLGAPLMVGMFLAPGEAAYTLAAEGLPLFAPCALFFALNIAFIGYYQSVARAGISTFYVLLRGVIFVVPGFVVLPHVVGVAGLWLAVPAAELATFAVIAAVYGIGRIAARR